MLPYNIRCGHSVTLAFEKLRSYPKKSQTLLRGRLCWHKLGNYEFKPDGAKANSPPARGQNINMMVLSCFFLTFLYIIWLFLCLSASVSTAPVSTRPWRTAMETLCPLLEIVESTASSISLGGMRVEP